MVGIAVEATVQKDHVERIDDADGFAARKDWLSDMLTKAAAFRKEAQWAQAALGYTNYVNECRKLVALARDRNTAKTKRAKAESARKRAADTGAEKYAKVRWNETVRCMNTAQATFRGMRFFEAGEQYDFAVQQFELCIGEANTERERLEAEAKAKAEQEARERERRKNWRKEGEEFTINSPSGLDMTMKWCPAGTFMMGSPATEEGRSDIEKQHQVTLTKGFWMGETEVTQGQWKKLMNGETIVDLARKGLQDDKVYNIGGKQQTLRELWGMTRNGDPMNRCGDLNDNVPIYYVNWYEAVDFCRRLTNFERAYGRIPDGYEYRLPTEAEWEYACRAGSTFALPNGTNIRILGLHNAPALDWIAWYGGNSSVGFNGRGWDTSSWLEKQHPGGRACVRDVKGKTANAWGLYDMIGNVQEWCMDCAAPYDANDIDPVHIEGDAHISRGGSWFRPAAACRSAKRSWSQPTCRERDFGFRVALAPMLPEGYRKARHEELRKANVVTRHEQYPTLEGKRERQPEANRKVANEEKSERDEAHEHEQREQVRIASGDSVGKSSTLGGGEFSPHHNCTNTLRLDMRLSVERSSGPCAWPSMARGLGADWRTRARSRARRDFDAEGKGRA